MNRLILILTFVLMFSTALFAAEGKHEALESWDFGQVKQGQVLKHEFTFMNTTGKPLNIKNVSTSCGCTTSGAKKKIFCLVKAR